MSCTSPLKRWVLGYDGSNDKVIQKVTSYDTKFVLKGNNEPVYEFEEIPCGKCISCRLEHSRQWANRCMLEAKNYENNQFITLTYNDENLPVTKGINIKTGEVDYTYGTLNPEHLTKFMKDLRRYYEYHYDWKYKEHEVNAWEEYDRYDEKENKYYKIDNHGIRFYACGEYGSEKKTERPHYHIIAFNLPIYDKKYLFTDPKTKTKNYTSEILDKIWDKKGIVGIADVVWECCAYVARYCLKKAKGKEAVEIWNDTGREQEFTRMSRNPGIGKYYYEKHKDEIYEHDEIWLKNKKGAIKTKPCRYYDKLYDFDSPEIMEAIKKARKTVSKEIEKLRRLESNLTKEEYMQQQEMIVNNRIKRLKRGLE